MIINFYPMKSRDAPQLTHVSSASAARTPTALEDDSFGPDRATFDPWLPMTSVGHAGHLCGGGRDIRRLPLPRVTARSLNTATSRLIYSTVRSLATFGQSNY